MDNSFFYWRNVWNWVFSHFKIVKNVYGHAVNLNRYTLLKMALKHTFFIWIGKIVQNLRNPSILFLCISQMLQWEARLDFCNWIIIEFSCSRHAINLSSWLLDKRSRLMISCLKLSCICISRHFGVSDSHVTSQITWSTVFLSR